MDMNNYMNSSKNNNKFVANASFLLYIFFTSLITTNR